jgi:signal transduction histidine kinase
MNIDNIKNSLLKIFIDSNSVTDFCKMIVEEFSLRGYEIQFSISGVYSQGYSVTSNDGNIKIDSPALPPISDCTTNKWNYNNISGIICLKTTSFNNNEASEIIDTCTDLIIKRLKKLDSTLLNTKETAIRVLGINFHDVRNSMGSVSGIAQLLELDAADNDEVMESVREISSVVNGFDVESKEFMSLIRDGMIEYDNELVNISELYTNHIKKSSRVFELSGITLTNNIEPDVNLNIDKNSVETVLTELLSNSFDAVEHSKLKEISIKLIKDSDYILFSIEDSGEGIFYDVQEYIFDRFYSTKPKRMGLGLYRVKRFVEDCGGTIKIASTPKQGSLITLKIPTTI